MSEENIEIVRRLYDAWNRRDEEELVALSDPEAEWVNSPTAVEPGTRRGTNELLAVRRPREVNPLRRQGQVGLTGACELTEPCEHQAHDLLHAQVWIDGQPVLAVPHLADGNGQAKLTAPRLGARCIEHA